MSYVDPTREQFGAMMKLPEEGAVHMLNMLRFRDKAIYEPGHPLAEKGLSGAEAYAHYGEDSAQYFQGVGGKVILSWQPRLVLIGPEDEAWDMVFIAEYPNAAAFGDMVKNPGYQVAVKHRQAAVLDSRLVRLNPQEAREKFAAL